MITSTHPLKGPSPAMLIFLKKRIGLSEDDLNLGIRQAQIEQAPLPIVLWSFGIISLNQLQMVLDWEIYQS